VRGGGELAGLWAHPPSRGPPHNCMQAKHAFRHPPVLVTLGIGLTGLARQEGAEQRQQSTEGLAKLSPTPVDRCQISVKYSTVLQNGFTSTIRVVVSRLIKTYRYDSCTQLVWHLWHFLAAAQGCFSPWFRGSPPTRATSPPAPDAGVGACPRPLSWQAPSASTVAVGGRHFDGQPRAAMSHSLKNGPPVSEPFKLWLTETLEAFREGEDLGATAYRLMAAPSCRALPLPYPPICSTGTSALPCLLDPATCSIL